MLLIVDSRIESDFTKLQRKVRFNQIGCGHLPKKGVAAFDLATYVRRGEWWSLCGGKDDIP